MAATEAALVLFVVFLVQDVPQRAEPSAQPPAEREITVIERRDELENAPPINSRIRRSASDAFAADPVAAMHLREWAECIVMMHRGRALSLLASPLNSPEQTEIINRLTGNNFAQRTVCARFRSMRVDNLVLRGALGEALYRWEERRGRSAGPLTPPPPRDQSGPQGQLARMGRCVVEHEPEAVHRLMATRAGTGEATRLLADMEERIDACLPQGVRATSFHPLALRGALGEPYYLSRRAAPGR